MDWINLTGAKKVQSFIDKVYKRKNQEIAWEQVQAHQGRGGVDGQSLEAFRPQRGSEWSRLPRAGKEDTYPPPPVRPVGIPKAGQRAEFGTLGIPTIYGRVCQQALLQRRGTSKPCPNFFSWLPTG